MAKKTYRITVKRSLHKSFLLNELKAWGVLPSSYQVEGDIITTQDKNVVDVTTETFWKHPELIEIKVEKEKDSVPGMIKREVKRIKRAIRRKAFRKEKEQ